ncbi:hypothetical protein A8L33_14665 [Microbacterium aurantiacum]|uniref:Membrane protein n=1 Tax=Microbacterium aurantiacum TaxID=162393 RepID=A0A0M8ME80_9MICO|nr:hypothetical protein A8L33_14665 [Microbacterium chocolatum]KOS10656.1 membrane protein [Microbacterium chocolatum]
MPPCVNPRTIAVAALVDGVAVIAFAATGRASHGEAVLAGLAITAWPFLVALAVGWLVALAWRRPLAPIRTGIPIWVITVALGMLLRAASGQGTALAFVIVAALTLGLLLIGWRALATLATLVTLVPRRARTRHPE